MAPTARPGAVGNVVSTLIPAPSPTVNGLRHGLRLGGSADGRPLVLLHGFADCGASFEPLATAIELFAPGGFRFIAPDWRGHGDSAHQANSYWFAQYLADLEALLDQVASDAAPVVLAGHSMGGQVASQYAGLRPARVSHLVTLDSLNVPAADSAKAPKRYRRWLDALDEPPRQRMHDSLASLAERIRARYPELDADSRRFLAEHWSSPAPGGARRLRFDPWHRIPFPYGFRADDAMAIWREVTAPVLCIDAGDSPALRYVAADEMARRRACFADLEHRVIDGCGHMLHLQSPPAVARVMIDFLCRGDC